METIVCTESDIVRLQYKCLKSGVVNLLTYVLFSVI